MRKSGRVLVVAAALLAGAVQAQDAQSPTRPMPRPMAVVAEAAGLPLLRPRPRPEAAAATMPAALPLAETAAGPALPAEAAPRRQAEAATAPAALPVLIPAPTQTVVPALAAVPLPAIPPHAAAPAQAAMRERLTVSTSGQRVPQAALPPAGEDQVIVAAATADSPRPRLRPAPPGPVVPAAAQAPVAVIDPLPRPKARPAALAVAAPEPATEQATDAPAAAETAPVVLAGLARSLRPEARPKGLAKRRASEEPAIVQAAAVKVQPGGVGILPKKGSLCGDRSIRGETMGRITAKVAGCGIEEPVKVTHVAGVKLSQAALMDCPTALALRAWVEKGLQPNFGRNPVVELKVAGHYVCRTRNHKKGAKVSEHGKGRAIDISGFTLANGKTISILKGWRGDYGKAIRAAHKAACGTFGTTLGPGSDGYHEDHLHFDTARYRSGPYCR